jgi:hypothetical protein
MKKAFLALISIMTLSLSAADNTALVVQKNYSVEQLSKMEPYIVVGMTLAATGVVVLYKDYCDSFSEESSCIQSCEEIIFSKGSLMLASGLAIFALPFVAFDYTE